MWHVVRWASLRGWFLLVVGALPLLVGCPSKEGETAVAPVAAVHQGGDQSSDAPAVKPKLKLETAQCRNGRASIAIGVDAGAVPKDASLVTVFVPEKIRHADPARLYAETAYQTWVSFPDASNASTATIFAEGKYSGQLTVWERAGDVVKDAAAQLNLQSTASMKYAGKGKLYVWIARGRTEALSNRLDIPLDFGNA